MNYALKLSNINYSTVKISRIFYENYIINPITEKYFSVLRKKKKIAVLAGYFF